jgi:hypothetical protein
MMREHVGMEYDVKAGLITVIIFLILHASVKPSDPFANKLSIDVWRIAMRAVMVYVCFLLFLLNLSAADARWLLTFVDPSLNT